MLSSTVKNAGRKLNFLNARIIIASQRRFISNDEMFEAFTNNVNVSSSKKEPPKKDPTTTISKSKSIPSSSTSKYNDPVININRGYSSSSNDDKINNKNKSINDIFTKSLNDFTVTENSQTDSTQNWSESFHGLGNEPFSKEAQNILYNELPDNDIEITPDGLLYLPEIKYRRILNKAFGAGAWGLAPRSETLVQMQDFGGLLTREYGLIIHGRLVSIARGEQTFFKEQGIPTATEGCKSNALMRCCKDLGIASELWDPRFIKKFKKKNCENIFVEYIPTKKKKKIWKRKDEDIEYPFKL